MIAADELLDANTAAKALSISTRHLAKLRDKCVIPTVRISDSRRGIRYSRSALNEFIAAKQSCKPAKIENE